MLWGHSASFFWTGRKETPTQDWFFYPRGSSSQLRMQAASHLELHSCMQQFKNCLVGLQCANFSHLQPFSVLQPVAPKPGGFSSGSRGCCRGDHYHTLPLLRPREAGKGRGRLEGLDFISPGSCRAGRRRAGPEPLSRPGGWQRLPLRFHVPG